MYLISDRPSCWAAPNDRPPAVDAKKPNVDVLLPRASSSKKQKGALSPEIPNKVRPLPCTTYFVVVWKLVKWQRWPMLRPTDTSSKAYKCMYSPRVRTSPTKYDQYRCRIYILLYIFFFIFFFVPRSVIVCVTSTPKGATAV